MKIRRFLAILSILLLCGCTKQETVVDLRPSAVLLAQKQIATSELLAFYQEQKAVNEDYIGWLSFENQSINLPVVQKNDNEYYLNVGFQGQNSTQGTVFLDYQNQLSDQNLILYGHLIYYDANAMFSPLSQLTLEENYASFRHLRLVLSEEVRNYEVAIVAYYQLYDEKMPYYLTDFGAAYGSYLAYLSEVRLYDTGVTLTEEDKLLTMQTCVRNREDLRLIVIAREIRD